MKIKKGLLERIFIDNIFYLFNIAALISAFFYDIRTGAVSAVIILIGIFCYIYYEKGIRIDTAFSLYVFFNLISAIWYLCNGESIWFFFSGISYNLIPSMLFLVGNSIDRNRFDKIINSIFISNMFIICIGLFFYLTNKSFYFTVMDTEFAYTYTYAHKFGSYLTCLVFGSMCVAQIGLLIYRIFQKKNKIITLISIPIIMYALLLNMERGAWLASIILLLAVVFVLLKDKKSMFYAIGAVCIISLILVAGIYFIQNYLNSNVYYYLLDRLGNMNNVFSSRSDQMNKALETFFAYPMGYGLGAAGNKAALNGGSRIVPDGNYFRILVELGVPGFLSFIYLLMRGIFRGMGKDFKIRILVAIIIAFAAHASGSNVFDFFYSSYIFWFILGYLSKPQEIITAENFEKGAEYLC